MNPTRIKLSENLLRGIAQWLVDNPKWAIVVAIFYFLSPIDLIPELFVGVVGFFDDFLMFLLPFVAREYLRRLKGKDDETPLP